MFKKIFFLSISAGIFSAVACIVYNKVYFFATETNFEKLVNAGSLLGINMIACIVAGIGYYLLGKWFGRRCDMIFNILFTMLSFASIMAPFAISLPLDIKNPELFPGLAVPMHFFPAISWFTLKPFFFKDSISSLNKM
jgi:hypothetical protein